MSTPLRRINSFNSPRRNWDEREHLPTLRDLPKSRYATCPCLMVFQPRRPRPLVFSHIEVFKMVESIATELRETGVRPQTACAFVLPNCIEAIVYFLALQWIGAVAVPVDPAYDEPLLSAILRSVSALTVVSPFVDEDDRGDDPLYQKVSSVCEKGGHVHWMIDRSTNKGVYLEMCGRRAGVQSAWAGGAGDFRFEPTDTAFHLPSIHPVAGFTVQFSHGDTTHITRLFVETYNFSQKHSTFLVLPLHSVHGLMCVLTTLTAGGSIAIADQKLIDTDMILKYVSTLSLNWLTADAKTLMSLFSTICASTGGESNSLKTLQFIRTVDGIIDKDLLEKVKPLLSCSILQSYGTAETGGLVTTNKLEDNKLGTFGKAVDSIQVQIFDEDARGPVSGQGEEGLIGVFGEHVNISSDREEDESVRLMYFAKEHPPDEKSFFLTGDRGFLDEEGCLCITNLKSCESDTQRLMSMLEEKLNERGREIEEAAREIEERRKRMEEEEARKREREEEEEEEEEDERKRQEILDEKILVEEQGLEEAEEPPPLDSSASKSTTLSSGSSGLSGSSSFSSASNSSRSSAKSRSMQEPEAGDDASAPAIEQHSSSSDKEGSSNYSIPRCGGESEESDEKDGDEVGVVIERSEGSTTDDQGTNEEELEKGDEEEETVPKKKESEEREGGGSHYLISDLIYRMNKMEEQQRQLELELEEERRRNQMNPRLSDLEKSVQCLEEALREGRAGSTQSINRPVKDEGEASDPALASNVNRSETSKTSDSGTSSIPPISSPGASVSRSVSIPVVDSEGIQTSSGIGVSVTSSSDEVDSDLLESEYNSQTHASMSKSVSMAVDNERNEASSGTDVSVTSSSDEVDSDLLESELQQSQSQSQSLMQTRTSSLLRSSSVPLSTSEEGETIETRVETLEEAVHHLLDELASNGQMEEMMKRLQGIEENQKRMDDEYETGHRREMEKLEKLVQQIDAIHVKHVAALQRCTSSLASIQRNQPKQIPPTVDVEELARAVRQAAASALNSSRDTTAAAAAAKEASDAAKSAAEAHAELLKKPDGDGSDGTVKKASVIPLEEVEHAIAAHPAVEVARAFGRPDRNHGWDVYCAVRLKSGARISEPWLKLHAQSMLPVTYVPKRFYFKDDLTEDEDRVALSTNRDLKNIASAAGYTKDRFVKPPAWAPLFRRRNSKTNS